MSSIYTITGSALLAQRTRLNLIASNMANADSAATVNGTPYRARFAVFEAQPMSSAAPGIDGVRVHNIVKSNAPFKEVYRPGSPLADASGYIRESNVSMVQQMTDMIDATNAYKANLSLLQETQQINLTILKAI